MELDIVDQNLNKIGMNSEEFKELVKDSKNYLEVSKKKGVKLDEILVNRYRQESHFIYELIQNADDEGAKCITFKLFENKLEFFHDGEDFNITDIKSITSAGDSSKKSTIDSQIPIGEFGIGFKSVFAITKSPEIYSGKFSVRIDDLFLPVALTHEDTVGSTKIVFIFNHDIKTPNNCFKIVKSGLENIGSRTLIFLRNIEQINIEIFDTKTFYKRDIINKEKTKQINIIFSDNNKVSKEQYLVFEKPVSYIEDTKKRNLKVEIAYKISQDEKIIPADYSKLIVFFNTDKNTYLNFLIQGPYTTDPSRDNIIDSEKSKKNKRLIEETANLIAESILIIRDSEYNFFDTNFLSLLPISSPVKPYDKGEIYLTIYDKVKQLFLSGEALLPTSSGNLSSIKNCILPSKQELSGLLEKGQIMDLYGVEYCISNEIVENEPDLKEYIKGLNIKEVNLSEFLDKLTESFLEKQSDEWIIEFYSIFSHEKQLFEKIKKIPIIRLENNEHSLPFNSNKEPLVYLPDNKSHSNFAIVKESICENINAIDFLEKLGIKPPDELARIKNELFPKYSTKTSFQLNDYLKDFSDIFNYYRENPENVSFIEDIKKLFIILCYNNKTSENILQRAEDCYLYTEDLNIFFKNIIIYFADTNKYESFKDINKFFRDILKINNLPKIINRPINFTEEEKKHIRNGKTYINDISIETIDIEGLDIFLSNLETIDESYTLWKIILSFDFYCLNGKYEWNSGNRNSVSSAKFDSQIIELLKTKNWLFKNSIDMKSYKPLDISYSDLNELYQNYDNGNESFKETVIQKLKFKQKIDIKSSLSSEDEKKRFDELEEKEKRLEEYENMAKEKGFSSFEEFFKSIPSKEITKKNENSFFMNHKIEESFEEDENNFNYSKDKTNNYISDEANSEVESDNKDFESKDDFELDSSNNIDQVNNLFKSKTQKQIIESNLTKHENKIISEQEKIELDKKILELKESIQDLPKYSFKWFKELLEVEYLLSEQKSTTKKEFSITFSKVEKINDSFIILKNPNNFIPNFIEDLSGIKLTISTISGKDRDVNIDGVQSKGNSLKVKLRSDSNFNAVNFNEIVSVKIDIKNLLFILEELKNKFNELPFSDEDNLKNLLPDSLEFIFGPPGTGKTTHLSRELISIMKDNKKVLVLTPTNKAADVIVKKIISENNDKTPDWLVRFGTTFENEIEKTGVLKDKGFDLESMNRSVVITTIARFPYSVMGSHELKEYNWDIIVFDESSMISLAGIIYTVLKKQNSSRIIIAGDPFQIPPIVYAEEWKDENIYTLVELNNFENTTTSPKDFKVHRLMKQYRSIESIGKLFSKYTYNGLLEHHRNDNDKNRKDLTVKNKPVKAINVIEFAISKEKRINNVYTLNKSPYQIYSALLSFELSLELKREVEKQWGNNNLNSYSEEENKDEFTIGIICPYKAQATIIDRLLNSLPSNMSNISIISGSVHGFQGDECDIVIVVLNPPTGRGINTHLNNKNILNVAISRAKNYLFIMSPENISFPEINKISNIINNSIKDNSSINRSEDIEKLMFDNSKFIEENTFVTSHQNINVYNNSTHKYEVRNKDDDAIDIYLKSL